MFRFLFGQAPTMTATETATRDMRLTVQYQGFDVERGRMDATELGAAIMGLGQMIGRTSRVLYGDETRVRLEVQADFRQGSFGVDFLAVAMAGDLLPSLTWDQLVDIATVLFGSGGVLMLLKWLKGRKPREARQEGDTVTIVNHGGDIQRIDVKVHKVYNDGEVRRGFKALAEPLEHPGIDSVEIQPEDLEPQRIERSDRDAILDAPPPGEEVSVDRMTTVVEVVSPVFKEGNKWRFSQGDSHFYAAIRDERFINRVERREVTFAKGDALRVEMEVEVTQTEAGLHFDRHIVKVLDHIRTGRGEQGHLGLE